MTEQTINQRLAIIDVEDCLSKLPHNAKELFAEWLNRYDLISHSAFTLASITRTSGIEITDDELQLALDILEEGRLIIVTKSEIGTGYKINPELLELINGLTTRFPRLLEYPPQDSES